MPVVPATPVPGQRAAVRTAVKNFLQPPAVAGLNKLYRSMPKVIDAKDYTTGQAAGTKNGAVGVVHIRRDFEERRAVGGATGGKKFVSHFIELNLFFRSIEPTIEAATDAFDLLMDATKARLHADRTLGDPTNVFQAGEQQLETEAGEAELEGDTIFIWGVVRFIVNQLIDA